MSDITQLIASLPSFDDESLALLRKALNSEMRSRSAKPQPASNEELYQMFLDTYEERWYGVEDEWAEVGAVGGRQALGPYRHPNPAEFDSLVKRFKTSAKTPKGIKTWLDRAHSDWFNTLRASYQAEKQAEEAVKSLIYRLSNERVFPKTIAWGRPVPKPEVRRLVSGSVPHLLLTWYEGSVTATER